MPWSQSSPTTSHIMASMQCFISVRVHSVTSVSRLTWALLHWQVLLDSIAKVSNFKLRVLLKRLLDPNPELRPTAAAALGLYFTDEERRQQQGPPYRPRRAPPPGFTAACTEQQQIPIPVLQPL